MIIKPNIRYDLEDLERFLKHLHNIYQYVGVNNIVKSKDENWTFYIKYNFDDYFRNSVRYYIRNEKTHEVIFYYADTFLTIKAKDVYHKFKWKK